MQVQKGLLSTGSSAIIDNLGYTYATGSNKLRSVSDAITSYTGDKLGDFQDGNTAGRDYGYDVNGNMTTDKNKNISLISYNILNLLKCYQGNRHRDSWERYDQVLL